MFSKTIALFVPTVFAILAAALPNGGPSISQCDTGDLQCCNAVNAANSIPGLTTLLGLLNILVQDPNVMVGLGCTPITVIGVSQGANCAQQPVCCTDNNFNGLVNLGCTPVSV